MKSINIKGKEYVEVNERIKYFRENYKEHKIITEIISIEDKVCVMKASILDNNNLIISTGHAYEKEDSSFINKTSYIENCETSAVGRALGILGIGIDASIASAEEVENAIKQQDIPKHVEITNREPKKTTDDKDKSKDWSEKDKQNAKLCQERIFELMNKQETQYKNFIKDNTSFIGKDGKEIKWCTSLTWLTGKQIEDLKKKVDKKYMEWQEINKTAKKIKFGW